MVKAADCQSIRTFKRWFVGSNPTFRKLFPNMFCIIFVYFKVILRGVIDNNFLTADRTRVSVTPSETSSSALSNRVGNILGHRLKFSKKL